MRIGTLKETRDALGRTPFLRAAFHGNLPALTALIEEGADTRVRDNQGRNALTTRGFPGNELALRFLEAVI